MACTPVGKSLLSGAILLGGPALPGFTASRRTGAGSDWSWTNIFSHPLSIIFLYKPSTLGLSPISMDQLAPMDCVGDDVSLGA